MVEFKVNHEKELNRFILLTEEGERVGRMSYTIGEDNIMTIDHTKVSLDLRGTGAGKHLIVAAVEYARGMGYKLNATCPYAKKMLEKHRKDFFDVLGPVLSEESEPEPGNEF